MAHVLNLLNVKHAMNICVNEIEKWSFEGIFLLTYRLELCCDVAGFVTSRRSVNRRSSHSQRHDVRWSVCEQKHLNQQLLNIFTN